MKLNGRKISGPNVEILVLPRPDIGTTSGDLVFKAQAVLDFSEFELLCPKPKVPMALKPGNLQVEDNERPEYKQALAEWSSKRYAYIVINSLAATPALEWETVKADQPDTWAGYFKELQEAGLSEIEIGRLINTVHSANCLDESKLEQARNRFLASAVAQPTSP